MKLEAVKDNFREIVRGANVEATVCHAEELRYYFGAMGSHHLSWKL